jgi:hypothetical protein
LRAALLVVNSVAVDSQPLISRSELQAALFALYDILEEVRIIRRLLDGGDGEEVEEDLGQ